MKQVGILTYHRACNYGAQVQCYALISFLQKKYPDVHFEVIDYQSFSEVKSYIRSILRNTVKVGVRAGIDEIKRDIFFSQFSNSLPRSSFKVTSDRASVLFKKIRGKYDLVISGSDAIFNWNYRKFPTVYFLGSDLKCRKASYAASAHAFKYRLASKNEVEYCRSALSGFDYLGVRDVHTEEFMNFCDVPNTVYHNCDPTFLLDVFNIDHKEIKKKLAKHGVNLSKPLIIVMTANPHIVKPVFDAYNESCDFVSVYLHNPLIKNFIPDLTPLEWAGLFGLSKLTITQYFHGTLLSLMNYTPVISVDAWNSSDGYEGKIQDVLCRRLGLNDFYFSGSDVQLSSFPDRAVSTAKLALEDHYTDTIRSAVMQERKSVSTFIEYLDSVLL